jgi:hypothetical protein
MYLNNALNKNRNLIYTVYAIVFILSLLVFDRGLFYLIRAEEKKIYKKKDFKLLFQHKRDFNKQFLELPKGTYNTLIMGSSRTHRGIHPHYIYKRLGQKAFKIARAKAQPKFDFFFYKEYKKYAGIPQVVIYGVDYFIFRLKTNPDYLQYLHREEDRKPNNGILLLISNKDRIDAFFTNMVEKWNRPTRSDTHSPRHSQVIDPFIGYGKQELLDEGSPSRFETFEYAPYPGVEGTWFFKSLKEFEKDGVKVVLVFLPEYIGTYKSNFQQEAFIKDIGQLVKPFRNVFIHNYNRPGKFPLSNADYFLDGGYGKTNSHLSLEGARVFNRMLSKDLKKYY